MTSVPGYSIQEEVVRSQEWSLLRGRRSSDNTAVFLKLPLHWEKPGVSDAKFAAEYTILDGYDSPHILAAKEQLQLRSRRILVLEHFSGLPLSTLLGSGSFSLAEFLDFAIAFSNALAALHTDGIFHCGLNLDAVLFDRRDMTLKLTDFFSAHRPGYLPGMMNSSVSDSRSVPYIAPEQTGRLNRGVDHRTDLYAAGCVLYRCAVGRPPFSGGDPMEIIHGHLAREVPTPHQLDAAIPEMISKILLTLLAKNPDQRYQSAANLRDDLLRCREELVSAGRVGMFTPAQRDAAGRFQIPQHLLGREKEIERLQHCFDHAIEGKATSILIDGYTGVGKTALVQEMIQKVTSRRGYFIKGKADQVYREVPYHTITGAIRDFVAQILMEDSQRLAFWQSRFRSTLLPVAGVVTRLIPEMEYFLGAFHNIEELRQSEATQRFRETMRRLMAAISNRENPVILFLDDLQWMDTETLQLIQSMVESQSLKYMMLIGAMRGHEVEDDHPVRDLLRTLDGVAGHHGMIELAPLELEQVQQLLYETLSCSPSHVAPLSAILHRKTRGNPFFLKQLLLILHERQLLRFDGGSGTWNWDEEEIESIPHSENVIVLLTQRIGAFPEQTRDALTVAAFLGGTFTLSGAAAASEDNSIQLLQRLQPAIDARLILPADPGDRPVFQLPNQNGSDRAYRFLHDRVQQASYALTPEAERPQLHVKIGRLLRAKIPEEHVMDFAFLLADQLNAGRKLITDKDERRNLAELNYMAGLKAAESVAFTSAASYFRNALQLLDRDWSSHHRILWDLTHQLGRAQYALGNHDHARALFEELSSRATNVDEEVKAIMERVHLLIHFSQYDEALQLGREGLVLLGQRIPRKVNRIHVGIELLRVQAERYRKSPTALLALPEMTDQHSRHAVHLMCMLLTPAYFASKETIGFFNCRMMRLVSARGRMESAAYVCSQFGLILGAGIGRYHSAYAYAEIGLRMSEERPSPYWDTRTYLAMGAVVNHWTHDAEEDLTYLEKAAQYAKESGDLLYGLYPISFRIQTQMFLGRSLTILHAAVNEQIAYCERIEHPTRGAEAIRQFVLDLTGKSSSAGEFDVDSYDMNAVHEELAASGDSSSVVQVRILRLMSLYLAGRIEEAEAEMHAAMPIVDGVFGQLMHVDFVLFAGLTASATLRSGNGSDKDLRSVLKKQISILRRWSKNCPQNFEHRYWLLQAEQNSLEGDSGGAIAKYERVLERAIERGDLQVEAMAAHCAARHSETAQLPGLREVYLNRAVESYTSWGATRCADRCVASLDHFTSSGGFAMRKNMRRSVDSAPLIVQKDASDSYDIASLMKAASVITGEIHFSALLDKLMSIMVENAGAENGVLFVAEDGELRSVARWDSQEKRTLRLADMAVEDTENVPTQIVRLVQRTKQPVMVENASEHERFSSIEDIRRRGVLSVLCGAILYQSELVGVVYLENNHSPGAFGETRIELLQLLSSQVATALVNARLYLRLDEARRSLQKYSEDLEVKVQERTADLGLRESELRKSNEQLAATVQSLQRAQSQLVQAEKMASLGELTAGIAHEIQNPLNFIQNFSELCIELTHELEGERSVNEGNSDDITAQRSLTVSLIDSAKKIGEHSRRASKIVRSMLDHSRSGSQERELTDVNALIADALELSRNGFRGLDQSISVDVQSQLGTDVPVIEVLPADMSRVFLNLFNNSFFFLREKWKQAEGAFAPQLTVSSGVQTDTLVVRIKDNGPGVADNALEKVFQPFFTTKATGEGTGLGLSISYTIVVDGHGGEMSVASQPGEWTEITIILPLITREMGVE